MKSYGLEEAYQHGLRFDGFGSDGGIKGLHEYGKLSGAMLNGPLKGGVEIIGVKAYPSYGAGVGYWKILYRVKQRDIQGQFTNVWKRGGHIYTKDVYLRNIWSKTLYKRLAEKAFENAVLKNEIIGIRGSWSGEVSYKNKVHYFVGHHDNGKITSFWISISKIIDK